MNNHIFKSIVSVVAGLVVTIVLSNGTDTILEQTGVFPSIEQQLKEGFTTPWMLTLSLFYRILYMMIGGYTTATLAPQNPIRHVLILGGIGTTLGVLGALAAWGIAPSWFLILITLAGLPSVWLGGKWRVKRLNVQV